MQSFDRTQSKIIGVRPDWDLRQEAEIFQRNKSLHIVVKAENCQRDAMESQQKFLQRFQLCGQFEQGTNIPSTSYCMKQGHCIINAQFARLLMSCGINSLRSHVLGILPNSRTKVLLYGRFWSAILIISSPVSTLPSLRINALGMSPKTASNQNKVDPLQLAHIS